jgi:hypothetical protein
MPLVKSPYRDGTVAVATAVCLIGILAVIALSLDGGLLLDKRRQAQATADAAALAAASELYRTAFTNGGLDNGPLPNKTGPAAGDIAAFAREVARVNGFEDGQNGVTVEVHIPPVTGPFTGQAGHVEVKITTPQRRHFSRVFGPSDEIPVGARAVARGRQTTIDDAMIILDPTLKGSFQTSGGGTVTATGSASIVVNSSDPQAMIANGGGTVSAVSYSLTGIPGWSTPGSGFFGGTIHSGQAPMADPLRFLPQPDPSALVLRSKKRLNIVRDLLTTLEPGLYIGGVSISGKGSVLLLPGIYYMQGGFSYSGQGSLTGHGVVIYNDPQSISDSIDLSGLGAVTLTPPLEGAYKGMTLFQSRSSSFQPTVSVTGSGSSAMYMTGSFYVPQGELKVTGNGTQDTLGSQYISDTLVISGNGSFNVHWDPKLVPAVREVWLVE